MTIPDQLLWNSMIRFHCWKWFWKWNNCLHAIIYWLNTDWLTCFKTLARIFEVYVISPNAQYFTVDGPKMERCSPDCGFEIIVIQAGSCQLFKCPQWCGNSESYKPVKKTAKNLEITYQVRHLPFKRKCLPCNRSLFLYDCIDLKFKEMFFINENKIIFVNKEKISYNNKLFFLSDF